jgi:hypothetical protein
MMAAKARFWTPASKQPTFNLQSLWELAVWGICASVALGLAVAASYSQTGSRRLMLAMDAMDGSGGEAQKAADGIQASIPSRDAAIDIVPLVETVRVLAAERDRLTARLGRIERHLDDLTGSIAPTGTGGAAPPHAGIAPGNP